MNRPLSLIAVVLSVFALYLSARTQAFTRVTVDGRGVRMLVAGSGDATVVFEAGGGGVLENWGKVQPAVSTFAKTVSYDRAGQGLSDQPAQPQDARRIAADLHEALRTAGIVPPYILAGASVGGLYVRVFAGMYPGDVAGVVLVDPTNDTQQFDEANPEVLPSWQATLQQARASRVPPGIPVFLIDAVSPLEVPFANDSVRAMRLKNRPEIEADSLEYKRWLNTFQGGRLIVTNRSGHNVALEQPELVVDTIREAVSAAQQHLSK